MATLVQGHQERGGPSLARGAPGRCVWGGELLAIPPQPPGPGAQGADPTLVICLCMVNKEPRRDAGTQGHLVLLCWGQLLPLWLCPSCTLTLGLWSHSPCFFPEVKRRSTTPETTGGEEPHVLNLITYFFKE